MSTDQTPAHLALSNVHAAYGSTEVLHGLDLDVRPGEVVALIGSNGAGKSTLARAVTGFCTVTSGSITLNGEELVGRKPYLITRKGVGHVPEGRHLFGSLTVADNLGLAFAWQSGTDDNDVRLSDVYERFPRLYDRREQIARTLSGGEQQMLAIGRGLLLRPRVLILDEPSTGLAPLIVEQIFETVRGLVADMGVSMLLIEQNMETVLQFANRGYVMQRGQIAHSGPASDLLANSDVRAMYLGR